MAGNRRFVVDFDLDDKGYREKLNRLISDSNSINTSSGVGGSRMAEGTNFSNRLAAERFRADEARRQFNQQYSPERVELARRRVQNQGAFAGKEDQSIVQEADRLDKLNKTLEEASKVQRLRNFEDQRRHTEFRTLTTQQLENQRRDLRKSATKDEREGRMDDADAKRRDIQAISQIISQREGQSPETAAIKSLGRHLFMNQAINEMGSAFGRGGQYGAHGINMGANAYSTMRQADASQMKSIAVGAGVGIAGMLMSSLKDAVEIEENTYKAASKLGNYSTIESSLSQAEGIGKSNLEFSREFESFLKRTRYTGSSEKIGEDLAKEERISKVLGLSAEDQSKFYTTGGYGDDMLDPQQTSLNFARFLEAKGAGGIKVGLNEDGTFSKDRNVNLLGDYLKKIADINEKIYKITGEQSAESQKKGMELFGSMVSLGGIFAREDVAAETVEGMRSGFAHPASNLHQFKNLQAYEQVMGGGQSLAQKMIGLENVTDPRIMEQAVNNLTRERFGHTKLTAADKKSDSYLGYLQDLSTQFGGQSLDKMDKFVTQWEKSGGKMSKADIEGYRKETDSEVFQTAAEKMVSAQKKVFTDFENTVNDIGTKIVHAINSLIEFLGGEPDAPAKPKSNPTPYRGGAINKNSSSDNPWRNMNNSSDNPWRNMNQQPVFKF